MQIIKLFDKNNIQSWEDLYLLLKENKNNGLLFEEFAKLFFLLDPVVSTDYNNVWLYKEIPLETKQKLNLGTIEYGIDILLESVSGEFSAVQCKFRSNQDESLSWSKDKIANLFGYGDKCDNFIVFCNCSKLDSVSINRKNNFQFINIDDLLQIGNSTFKLFADYLQSGIKKEIPKFKPKNHQLEAINKISEHFQKNNRGQLILPCGAGKTLTALWIKEHLKSKNTIVLLPSLALLRQVKNAWNEQKTKPYEYLCVCSETDIDSEKYDSTISHTYEIGGNVTTDKTKIQQFLLQTNRDKVIFSTYQSLDKIQEALAKLEFEFDLAICDEAHKTAGTKGNGNFGLIHSDENIKARKRLYMTATPRILSEKLKNSIGSKAEDLLYDMGDENVYGKEAYRMSFKDAIDLGILVDYKILGIGVSDAQMASFLKERRLVSNKATIEDYANNYALELVMNKYLASHAISFHSRINFAETFAKRHKTIFKDVYSGSVSGGQSTTHRNLILHEFKNKPKGLVSNARCLTEGVDVPVIDVVYFADPKNSKVDIVQAAGRALRTDKHGNKKMGYIVVPIFHHKNKDLDKAINEGVFRNLVNVIRSLCDQDERLQDEINKLAFQKGKRTALGERLEVVFEEADKQVVSLVGFEEKLRTALFDQVIEKASNNWGVKYENLKLWRQIYNDRWPQQIPPKRREKNTPDIIEENSLGVWLMEVRRRYREGSLDKIWVDKFNELQFPWDSTQSRKDVFDRRFFESLNAYIKKNKRLPKPKSNEPEAIGLRSRIENYTNGDLSLEYINLLDRYDFLSWVEADQDRVDRTWDDRLQEVLDYKGKHGEWPILNHEHMDSKSLGAWLSSQKTFFRQGKLKKDRIDKLLAVGIDFIHRKDKSDGIWDKHLEEVKKWYKENRKWPRSYSEMGKCYESKLGNWLLSQKNWYLGNSVNKSEYPKDRKKKLEAIGYSFERKKEVNQAWEAQFEFLEEFRKLNPNRWPKNNEQFPEGNNLGLWCVTQRQFYRKGNLEKFRQDLLKNINFNLIPSIENRNSGHKEYVEHLWYKKFEMVKELVDNKIKISRTKTEKEYVWLYKQKRLYKNNLLSDDKIELLKSLDLL